MENSFLPGSLIEARGRIWVVQSGSSAEWLKLRPIGGADDEITELSPKLEEDFHPIKEALFPLPNPELVGNFQGAQILFKALQFQLRQGAGPFRSFGSIAVAPHSYQMVPLLMAMKQQTVRLLIADDVGVGKTIEAGLILRELYERGEIENFAILCPPHLVDQWVNELKTRFNFNTKPLTAITAKRLESQVPPGQTLLSIFPFLVISLDYVKTDKHRATFFAMNFRCIVVDEAHTCTQTDTGRQLRFETLQKLSEDSERHMLFLTATPHSGKDDAFYNLLSLLDKKFLGLKNLTKNDNPLRKELAEQFVQRRRKDIQEWNVDENEAKVGFPRRMTAEVTYELSRSWNEFLAEVLDYCRSKIAASQDKNSLIWYSVLTLFRCISSSPGAARQALENRMSTLGNQEEKLDETDFEGISTQEENPVINLGEDPQLDSLLNKVKELVALEGEDKKLKKVTSHVEALLKDGFNPVVFCRYIATAKYVAEKLKDHPFFSKEILSNRLVIECITGELVPDERRTRIDGMDTAESRILVATDCLSEGINLQKNFNAVVHYDLAWNPTRHEQREGRVDRFGQSSKEVRCSMVYGTNNPIDGMVYKVILQKSNSIKSSLGVVVPIPEKESAVNKALVMATLFKAPSKSQYVQQELPFEEGLFQDPAGAKYIDSVKTAWEDALEKAKKTRTIFSQKSIHPEHVAEIWVEQQAVLGTHDDLEKFCRSASKILGCQLEPVSNKNKTFRIPLNTLRVPSLRERFADEDIDERSEINFTELHRTSNFVNILCEGVVEQALLNNRVLASPLVSRSAVAEIAGVEEIISIFLLRLRYQMILKYNNKVVRNLMCEEILPVGVKGIKNPSWLDDENVKEFLKYEPKGNFSSSFAVKKIQKALDLFKKLQDNINSYAKERSQKLCKEHQSVKQFTKDGAVAEVTPCLPVDLMGVFVLLPKEED